jgi:hypothetical protein
LRGGKRREKGWVGWVDFKSIDRFTTMDFKRFGQFTTMDFKIAKQFST